MRPKMSHNLYVITKAKGKARVVANNDACDLPTNVHKRDTLEYLPSNKINTNYTPWQ